MSDKTLRKFLWRIPASGERIFRFKCAAFSLLFFLVFYYGAYGIAQLHNYRIVIPEHGGQYLPFHPAWTLIYISIYIAQLMTPFAVSSKEECLAWSRSLCYSVALATCVFILFPTEQPSVEQFRELTHPWMEFYWTITTTATSGNAFPSLHVASMLCTVWYSTQKKPHWFSCLMYIWFLAIAYATVVLREHYLVDVLGGVIVAWFAIKTSQKKLNSALVQPAPH